MSLKLPLSQSPVPILDGADPIRIDWIPIEFIIKNPRNARTHPKKQIEKLARAIQATGFMNPIVADQNYLCLAGHGRLGAASLLGMKKVPVIKLNHFSDAQKMIYAIADNKIAEEAGWDLELLVVELAELIDVLPSQDLDVSLTGFETAEVDLLIADRANSHAVGEETAPPLPQKPVTIFGDKWQLGNHELLCGDARDPQAYMVVTGGQTISASFCDPPYNRPAKAIGGRGRKKHGAFAFGSGEMSVDAYRDFLLTTLGNGFRASRSGSVHYVCVDWRQFVDLEAAATALSAVMLNLVVWVKTNGGQGTFYRSQHELIAVFRIGDESHQNNVQLGRFGRNRTNVWNYAGMNTFGRDRLNTLASHPTVKPVALIADALLDCTSRNDAVLDQFCGSGSTILAAEKIGRIAFGIEYEPAYVDVAIKRWQSVTVRDAVLVGDGRTFDEIAAHRATSDTQTHDGETETGSATRKSPYIRTARVAEASLKRLPRKDAAHE